MASLHKKADTYFKLSLAGQRHIATESVNSLRAMLDTESVFSLADISGLE